MLGKSMNLELKTGIVKRHGAGNQRRPYGK